MSIINKLRDLFSSKPDLVHPILGNMVFDGLKGETGFWESEYFSEELKRPISVCFQSSSEGPADNQVEFLLNLLSNLEHEFDFFSSFLEKEYTEVYGPIEVQTDLYKLAALVGITVPENANRLKKWDISFEFPIDLNHMFTIYFEHGKPKWCSMDG